MSDFYPPCLKLFELLLGVGETNESTSLLDDDEPAPVPHAKELSEVALPDLDELPLVVLFLVNGSTNPLESLSLNKAHPLDDQFVALLRAGCYCKSE